MYDRWQQVAPFALHQNFIVNINTSTGSVTSQSGNIPLHISTPYRESLHSTMADDMEESLNAIAARNRGAFYRFNLLPTELRRDIWSLTAQHERADKLLVRRNDVFDAFDISSD